MHQIIRCFAALCSHADKTVEQRDIKIGLINDTMEEILSGIEDGDIVVLNNQDKLKDGTSVETIDSRKDASCFRCHWGL